MRIVSVPAPKILAPILDRKSARSHISGSLLSSLQTERFEQKTQRIQAQLTQSKGDWEQAFFLTLARNFGFGTNSDAFEQWAQTIPLQAVNKHRDNLFQIEAIFFGQAGLLQELPSDDYSAQLTREYAYLAHKFELQDRKSVV